VRRLDSASFGVPLPLLFSVIARNDERLSFVRCADRDETGCHRRKSLTTIMRGEDSC
jgi:hypothetical protein